MNKASVRARQELQVVARIIESAQRVVDSKTSKKLDKAVFLIGQVYSRIRDDETLITPNTDVCRLCKKLKPNLDINKVCRGCNKKTRR